MPDTITIEQLLTDEYSSYSRNRKVAATFKEAQLIETVRYKRTASLPLKTSKADENYGSGIRRIREAFEQYGLKAPKFENFKHGFRVIVYAERLDVRPSATRKHRTPEVAMLSGFLSTKKMKAPKRGESELSN